MAFYLYAYGNECAQDSEKIKCQLLNQLQIFDECDKSHIQFLEKWLGTNFLMNLKLKNCPQLPIKGAVKNTLEKILLNRNSDTISIIIKVKGLNELQEKYWDIEQKESFLILNNTLVKIKKL